MPLISLNLRQPLPVYWCRLLARVPFSLNCTEVSRGHWPGRGLMYSFLVHETMILSLLLLPSFGNVRKPVRAADQLIAIDLNGPAKLIYFPDLNGNDENQGARRKGSEVLLRDEPVGEQVRSAKGLSYPGPQAIISEPPKADNRFQTLLQPALQDPPVLQPPAPLPNMIQSAYAGPLPQAPSPSLVPQAEPKHVPGVVRDGRGGGGGVRRATDQRSPLGAGGGVARARAGRKTHRAHNDAERLGDFFSARSRSTTPESRPALGHVGAGRCGAGKTDRTHRPAQRPDRSASITGCGTKSEDRVDGPHCTVFAGACSASAGKAAGACFRGEGTRGSSSGAGAGTAEASGCDRSNPGTRSAKPAVGYTIAGPASTIGASSNGGGARTCCYFSGIEFKLIGGAARRQSRQPPDDGCRSGQEGG